MKNWLPRIGWMCAGACLLTMGIIIHAWLFGDRGHMFRNAQASHVNEIISSLKKGNCNYTVIINVPKQCKDVLNEAVKSHME